MYEKSEADAIFTTPWPVHELPCVASQSLAYQGILAARSLKMSAPNDSSKSATFSQHDEEDERRRGGGRRDGGGVRAAGSSTEAEPSPESWISWTCSGGDIGAERPSSPLAHAATPLSLLLPLARSLCLPLSLGLPSPPAPSGSSPPSPSSLSLSLSLSLPLSLSLFSRVSLSSTKHRVHSRFLRVHIVPRGLPPRDWMGVDISLSYSTFF